MFSVFSGILNIPAYIILIIYGANIIFCFYRHYQKEDFYARAKKTSVNYLVIMAILVFASLVLGAHRYANYGTGVAWTCIIGGYVLSLLFDNIKTLRKSKSSRIFYGIGLFLTVLMTFELQEPYSDTVIDRLLAIPIAICGMIVFGALFAWGCVKLIDIFKNKNQDTTDQRDFTKGRISPKMAAHYEEVGLSGDQLKYFRQEMRTARDLIFSLEEKFTETARLRAIEQRHNTVETCQSLFQHVVQNPDRLIDASPFIHSLLPSLEDLVSKYNEINGHVAKNKQTYLILEKTAQTIERLCEEISDEYISFHRPDFEDLEDEIHLANKNINNKEDEEFDKEDLIDDIINEGREEL